MPYYDIVCDGCGEVLTDYILVEELNEYLEQETHSCGGNFSVKFNNFTTSSDKEVFKSQMTREQMMEEDFRRTESQMKEHKKELNNRGFV